MFLSALWGILASFSSLFWFLVDSHLSEQPQKKEKRKRSDKPAERYKQ